MRPRFNHGIYNYITLFSSERKFNLTSISGWEKKHYIPDAPDVLGVKEDFTTYTSADNKYLLAVSVRRDRINLLFCYREKTNAKAFGQIIPNECLVAKQISTELSSNAIEKPEVHLVDNLPHIAELKDVAFYLVRGLGQLTMYFADPEHGLYSQVNSKSSSSNNDFHAGIGLLAESIGRGEVENRDVLLDSIISKSDFKRDTYNWRAFVHDFDEIDKTVLIQFDSENDVSCYGKLLDSLSIFKKHHDIDEGVINEIVSIISNKKSNLLQDRVSLAEKISNDQEAVQKELTKLLTRGHPYGDTRYVKDIAQWFLANNNPDISIFLCMCFPDDNIAYLDSHEAAKGLLFSSEYSNIKNEYYMRMLLTVAFRIAIKTNKKEDIAFAMNLSNELELCDTFEQVEIEKIDRDSLAELLIAKTIEIRKLKEKLKQAEDMAPVSGAARLTFVRTLEKEKSPVVTNKAGKLKRRNSI